MHNISNHTPLQRKQLRQERYIPPHPLAIRIINMVMIPTRFLSARLYAGVFEVPRAAAWIVQRGTRHFTSHTNNLRLKIKPFNLHYVQFMFLYPLGVVPIQLQRSCNSAAAPHLQLKKTLTRTAGVTTTQHARKQQTQTYLCICCSWSFCRHACLLAAVQLQLRT